MGEKKGFSTEYYRFSERIKTIEGNLTRKISGVAALLGIFGVCYKHNKIKKASPLKLNNLTSLLFITTLRYFLIFYWTTIIIK